MKISLAELRNNPDFSQNLIGKNVVIWSDKLKVYWKERFAGYTGNILQAGIYPFGDAYNATQHCGDDKTIFYISDIPTITESALNPLQECLEWFWLWQDTNEIYDMYFDEDAPPISDDGIEAAECLESEAWAEFEKLATQLRENNRL